ncbi:GAF and ANTAR domain-containing protein [Streptomyces sp. NRRL S-920]|uniref:GAF and ANTAR domain-containing protein n=1 Tax=Streptomyces sp. NRRL S-920 TaxID=1463921 RepID=UPI0004C9694B|nr:GAF and ANTAR domain-containing protein [Streptomyces sp. NRRL S-920]
MSRERKIAETFVELADTLVADLDITDFSQQLANRCCDLFAIADAAVMLAHPGPQLYCAAPSDPSPALEKLLHLAPSEGPALDAYRTATPALPGDPAHTPDTWRGFTAQAREAGYTYAGAVPLRLGEESIGSLLLLCTSDRPLPTDDLALAEAFADAATIGLLHARTLKHAQTVNEQLHTALRSRVVIEQGKGFLAARRELSLDDAFAVMRGFARRHRLPLTAVARHIVETGDLPRPPSAAAHQSAQGASE